MHKSIHVRGQVLFITHQPSSPDIAAVNPSPYDQSLVFLSSAALLSLRRLLSRTTGLILSASLSRRQASRESTAFYTAIHITLTTTSIPLPSPPSYL